MPHDSKSWLFVHFLRNQEVKISHLEISRKILKNLEMRPFKFSKNLKGEISHHKQRSQNILLKPLQNTNGQKWKKMPTKNAVLFFSFLAVVHCAMCFYAMTQSTFCWDLMVFASKWVHISFLLCVAHITKYSRIAALHYQN